MGLCTSQSYNATVLCQPGDFTCFYKIQSNPLHIHYLLLPPPRLGVHNLLLRTLNPTVPVHDSLTNYNFITLVELTVRA